jgi:hypothetical protein
MMVPCILGEPLKNLAQSGVLEDLIELDSAKYKN